MKGSVFDIEADGLEATKIHCLSTDIGDKIISTTSYKAIRGWLSKTEILVGHNIARYDIPTMERILGVSLEGKKFVDTLALSWYLQPERNLHGLESYGEEYKMPKVVVDDWENLSAEDYITRCKRDVEINSRLWREQYNHLLQIYEDDDSVWRFLDYLSFKMTCAVKQETQKWRLDVQRCTTGRDVLTTEWDEKIRQLADAMPRVPIVVKKTRPKKPFKQDGTHSAIGETWFSLLASRGLSSHYNGVVEIVTGDKQGNPSSHAQIKDWLFSLGWKPDEYKYVRDDEEKGGVRKIPQVNKQSPGEVGVCESVKHLFEKEPSLELLDGLSVISHRLSILNGFLKSVDKDGYIKAEIQGLTNTLRFKHATVVNLPGVTRPYGDLIRGCLIAPDGYEVCGSDMSSLEDRIKQHYMMPYDPDYVKEMMADDYDPHTGLAVFAKVITAAEEAGFKRKQEPAYALVKAIRKPFKNTNYACQYGAGAAKVALTANITLAEAKKLHKAYWERNWSIKKIANDCYVRTVRGQMWLFNPISKFYYSLRHDKDKFSTLCQGSGVYCFDVWIRKMTEFGYWPIGQFHDEVVLCILQGVRDKVTAVLKQCIALANDELALNRLLDVDIQFGNNYAEIH